MIEIKQRATLETKGFKINFGVNQNSQNIAKANEELGKLNYNSEIETKAKQMVLDKLNQ